MNDKAETKATRTVTIRSRQGLHARPASLIARLSRSFNAKVYLVRDHDRVDATDVIHILALGIMPDEKLRLEAIGAQAEEAADAVARLITEELPKIED